MDAIEELVHINTEDVRILVVDDEEVIRIVLEDTLAGVGYKVQTAASGEEAIALLEKEPFNLVITDVKMPGADGVDVLKAAKRVDPRMDVVVVTGYASLDTAVELMKLGAADYIPKPFNIDHIRMVVAKLLRNRQLEEKAREAERYRELSRIDGLTGLYNHRTFKELLAQEVSRAERYEIPLSILMFDLDHFKRYNDTYGHPAGDLVLKEIANLFRKSLRGVDYPARYGGEEFAIILPQTPKSGMIQVGKRIVEDLRTTRVAPEEGEIARLTLSGGGAEFPQDAQSVEGLVQMADKALYQAKQRGRNRFCYWNGSECVEVSIPPVGASARA